MRPRTTAAVTAALVLVLAAIAYAATVTGTTGNDRLRGTQSADEISALAGNDRVFARGGNDQVTLGDGRDRAEGGRGNDELSGEGGRDSLDGQRGNDEMNGGDGNDRLKDRKGADTFNGGDGNDRIDARDRGRERGEASSADTVDCGAGTDSARVDSNDTVSNCEKVRTRGRRGGDDNRRDGDHGGPGPG